LGARHLCRFNVQTEWGDPFHPTPPVVRAVKRHKCRAPAVTQRHRSGLAGLETILRFSAASAPSRSSGFSFAYVQRGQAERTQKITLLSKRFLQNGV
jgi:hypothetical protein